MHWINTFVLLQAKVVHIVAKWFANFNSSNPGLVLSKPEICLVHGIFGSGKSMHVNINLELVTLLSELGS